MIETNRIEFKRELSTSFEKTVIGFLNYEEGGIIYIGIDDNGTVVGISNIDHLERQIIDKIKNNILPSTMGLFDIITTTIENKDIIKIIVSSGPDKPYYLRSKGMTPKGCYIRLGNTVQSMTINQIENLFTRRVRNSLEKLQSPRQDLTFKQLKIYYEESGFKINPNFLQNLGLMNEKKVYNYAGYLLADHNSISMKVAKYHGTDKTILVENEEYGYCSLVKATDYILNRLEIENITKTTITAKKRTEKKLVDSTALREAVINAVVHNDYTNGISPVVEIFSNRIVITSTGGLPQDLTKEDFFEGISAPRNRELMRVFKDLKFVEQLGSGIQRILKVYDASVFKIKENFLQVIFPYKYSDDKIGENITHYGGQSSNEQRIIDLLKQNPYYTSRELSEITDQSLRKIEKYITLLKYKNVIKRVGSDTKGYWMIIE